MRRPNLASKTTFAAATLLAAAISVAACGGKGSAGSFDEHEDGGPAGDGASSADAVGAHDGAALDGDALHDASPDPLHDGAAQDAQHVTDGGGTDTGAMDAGADVVVTGDGGFVEAMHSLPNITYNGGPVLSTPLLVSITYANDPNAAFEQQLGAFMVKSSWLQTGGKEYGVGLGTATNVPLTQDAPSTIDDSTIQTNVLGLIESGMAPDPAADGGISQAIYMVYLPSTTTETVNGSELCVISGGGYHSESSFSVHGHTVAYAVVSECPGNLAAAPPQDIVWAASHEFIEASTDPYIGSAPAYVILDMTQPWSAISGEVGDLCSFLLPQWTEGSYTALQRIYSNASAKAGGPPCIPSPEPYYAADVEPSQTFIGVPAGMSTTFQMTGWSTAPVPAWDVTAQALVVQGSSTPTIALGAFSLQNGQKGTMTVSWPTGTPSGSYADVLVESYNSVSGNDYTTAIVGVYVP